ncbi:hypothetical protein HW452_16715 [Halomonas aquamarina]|uniref:Uncharacterized protein n=1 Tax=Vreelandella aquamarina TaxID=77097 RepID=A0ACC5VZ37_9GAMM|nr:hypothetical protein [Halomonas aquamarina]MBZ5489164.1 hypothetical protein [Halomonas aquamarina]
MPRPMLKPVDHQNIVLRLLGRTGPAAPEYLTTLAHGHGLPVSLHQIRVACDALVEEEYAAGGGDRYRLTVFGAHEALAVPLLRDYCMGAGGDA